MKKSGLVHIYSGEGKGKTTAAVGLTVRALAHGLKVCYAYFNKNPALYGSTEIVLLEQLGAVIFGTDAQHPSFDKSATHKSHSLATKETFYQLINYIENNNFDMLVMDEILISVRDNYIEEKDLTDFIRNKPKKLELVLTGRGVTSNLMDVADYINIITLKKHPYQKGIKSREGIEY